MKHITILLSTLAMSIASVNVMAFTPVAKDSPGLSHKAVTSAEEVPDYNHLPPGVDLLKNAIRNPDGSLTIKAGHQTAEANDINRRYCESLGGIDITNERDQTIGVGTLYTVICKKPTTQQPSAHEQVTPDTNRNPFSKK